MSKRIDIPRSKELAIYSRLRRLNLRHMPFSIGDEHRHAKRETLNDR
jgi:hypothetical protein